MMETGKRRRSGAILMAGVCLACSTGAFVNNISLSSLRSRSKVLDGRRCKGGVRMAVPSTPIPRNIKDTVSSLRKAVQAGLQSRCSRMDVELPFGARLGVEAGSKTEDEVSPNRAPGKTAGRAALERSDRELARLIIEMFSPIGDNLVVAFATDAEARAAKSAWAASSYKGKIASFDSMGKAKSAPRRGGVGGGKGGGGGGFAKKMEALMAEPAEGVGGGLVPPETEVFVVVAPQQKELTALERVLPELGMSCLVLLLNARLDQAKFSGAAQQEAYLRDFEGVFHLSPLGREGDESESFVYRAFPAGWTIARKPKLGPPKVLRVLEERPSPEAARLELEVAAAEAKVAGGGGIFGGLFGS
ncbi:unnamed protein product [Phaeothamnion confervicola]